MGFGKTVTALSTILDGRRLGKYDEKAPTLIVVPSGMVGHWLVYFDYNQVHPAMKWAHGNTQGGSNQQVFRHRYIWNRPGVQEQLKDE